MGRFYPLLSILLLLCCGAAPTQQARKPDEAAAIKAALGQRATQLEAQIAQRMMRRVDTTPEKLPRLEMEIDLRIMARWLVSQAMAAQPGSDVQAAANLRADQVISAAVAIEETMNKGAALPSQADGMKRLRQLTFELGEAKTLGQLDEAGKKLGIITLLLGAPGGEKTMPAMRPKFVRPPVDAEAPPIQRPKKDRPEPRTVAQLAGDIPRMNVSVPLRQQLAALATLAGNPKPEDDKNQLAQMLETAVDLAGGLQNNIGVSPEMRIQMEEQLAGGVALFLDKRMRKEGQGRVAALQQYRETLQRINRMGLTPQQKTQFGPIFTWAQQHPDQGGRTIGALEVMLDYRAKFEQRKATPQATAAMKRCGEELEKQFAAARSLANTAATEGKGDELDARVGEMRKLFDLLEKVDQLSASIERLNTFKPRPVGGLERRVAQAAAAIAGNSPQKNEGIKAIEDIYELSQRAQEIAGAWNATIPSEVDRKYAGGKLSGLETKWRLMVCDAASAIAAGGEMDAKKVERLPIALELYNGVKQAAAVEASLSATDSLARWVDWRMTADDLRAALQPYQDGLAGAIAGYISDQPKEQDQWRKTERRFRPLVQMSAKAGLYKDQCSAFPTGVDGSAAALLTPIENAPYAFERHVSFTLSVWKDRVAAGDRDGADDVMQMLMKRMGGD